MKKIWNKFKYVLCIIGGILLIALVAIPIMMWYTKNKNNKKTISIYPEFKVKKVTRKTQVDNNALEAGIRMSKEIMLKMTEGK